MIELDQPSIFEDDLQVIISSINDGTIRYSLNGEGSTGNLIKFCQKNDLNPENTVGLLLRYDNSRTYDVITEVSSKNTPTNALTVAGWVEADALVTADINLRLILPVADCNAIIYYDTNKKVVGLAHIGRHATVNNLASKMVKYFEKNYDSNPKDLKVFFSPSIRKNSYVFDQVPQPSSLGWNQKPYVIKTTDGKFKIDLIKYNFDRLLAAGVPESQIEISPIDTFTSNNYPSHTRSMRNKSSEQRFAVIAGMR